MSKKFHLNGLTAVFCLLSNSTQCTRHKTSPFTLVVWNRLEGGGGCLVSVSIAVSQKGDNDAGERGSLNDHATFANSLV